MAMHSLIFWARKPLLVIGVFFTVAVDLGVFEVGQILALHREGYSHRQIAERVTRGRDQAGPSLTAVGDVACANLRVGNDDLYSCHQQL